MILPKLEQAMMSMSIGNNNRVKKLVMVCKEVGLCIHKDTNTKLWVISQFQTGKSALKYIKSKNEAILYLVKLQELMPDWHFTIEEWDDSEWKHRLKKPVDDLQKEIMQVEV